MIPTEEMPEDLRAHVRYPEEQFNVQTRMFGRYHVRDPLRFFNGDDPNPAATMEQVLECVDGAVYAVLAVAILGEMIADRQLARFERLASALSAIAMPTNTWASLAPEMR